MSIIGYEIANVKMVNTIFSVKVLPEKSPVNLFQHNIKYSKMSVCMQIKNRAPSINTRNTRWGIFIRVDAEINVIEPIIPNNMKNIKLLPKFTA